MRYYKTKTLNKYLILKIRNLDIQQTAVFEDVEKVCKIES